MDETLPIAGEIYYNHKVYLFTAEKKVYAPIGIRALDILINPYEEKYQSSNFREIKDKELIKEILASTYKENRPKRLEEKAA